MTEPEKHRELASAREIGEEFGMTPGAARKWLSLHGIKHKATRGPRDERLFDLEEARAERNDPSRSPGRGARTDLRKDDPAAPEPESGE